MEYITPYVGKNLYKKYDEDKVFNEKHHNCSVKCWNCSKSFDNQHRFNEHLTLCINTENIPSLREKISYTENRNDIISASTFTRNKKSNGKRRQRICYKCGDFIKGSAWVDEAGHICKKIDDCIICGSSIPASFLENHTSQCLNLAKSVLVQLEAQQQMNLAQDSNKKHEEIKNPGPNQDFGSSQTSDTGSSQASGTSSSQASGSSQGSSSSYDEKLSKTKKRNESRRNIYHNDKVISNLTQILESSVNNDPKPNNSPIETRSMQKKPKNPSEEVFDEPNLDSKTKSLSDVFLKHSRRSKELNSLIDSEPIVSFFKSCSSRTEKKLIMSSILKDNMIEEDFAFYAKIFNVKKDYVRHCYSERMIKQSEGIKYRIEAVRCDDGQINLSEEIKDQILSTIAEHWQLYPGQNEEVHLRVSSVKDRSLIRFYNDNMKIKPVRNRDHYAGSRHVLQMSYRTFFDEFIKPKYDVSYGQFRNLVPYNCYEICMGWSQSGLRIA